MRTTFFPIFMDFFMQIMRQSEQLTIKRRQGAKEKMGNAKIGRHSNA